MNEGDGLAERFEAHRGRLHALAYRMLGSRSEAEDAVQEAWLHLARVDAREVDNLGGWLRTAVTRICLDILRSRRSRPEHLAGQEVFDEVPDGEPGRRTRRCWPTPSATRCSWCSTR
ncbi:sigma factor [Nonomuraea antimicrobica]